MYTTNKCCIELHFVTTRQLITMQTNLLLLDKQTLCVYIVRQWYTKIKPPECVGQVAKSIGAIGPATRGIGFGNKYKFQTFPDTNPKKQKLLPNYIIWRKKCGSEKLHDYFVTLQHNHFPQTVMFNQNYYIHI